MSMSALRATILSRSEAGCRVLSASLLLATALKVYRPETISPADEEKEQAALPPESVLLPVGHYWRPAHRSSRLGGDCHKVYLRCSRIHSCEVSVVPMLQKGATG